MDWNLTHEVIKALLSCFSGAIILLFTWLVGQRLSYRWSVRQKKREIQMAALQQSYVAYGEFFAVWKLWNRLEKDSMQFDERHWELHKRAAAAEAIVEGLLVKVSSELVLEHAAADTLGRFRQSFQQLRQSIRLGDPLPWWSSETPEYVSFKSLAAGFSSLLSREWPSTSASPERAATQLRRITSNHWEKH